VTKNLPSGALKYLANSYKATLLLKESKEKAKGFTGFVENFSGSLSPNIWGFGSLKLS
jgi:hypothetical protein